jgi:hypothetical protein
MRKAAIALAVSAIAVPGLAQAANISGTYALRYTTLCQSIEKEIFSPSTQIQTIDEGKLMQTIGFITFKPSTAGGLTGTVSAQLTQAKGSLAILGLPGGVGQPGQPAVPDMTIGSAPQSGTYSLALATPPSASTLKVSFNGESQQVFTVYPSKLANGTYGRVDFVDLDGNVANKQNCINSGSADLQ